MSKERPKECCSCKQIANIEYKEIHGDECIHTIMCENCPVLRQKLYGENTMQNVQWAEDKKLCCDACGMDYQSISIESRAGCFECYSIFQDLILEKIISLQLIPPQAIAMAKDSAAGSALHVGRSPHEDFSSTLLNQVTDLHEELGLALKSENYEKAAKLRDQIKQLMEKSND